MKEKIKRKKQKQKVKKEPSAKKQSFKFKNPIRAIQQFFANRSLGFQFLMVFVFLMVLFYTIYYSPFYINNLYKPIVSTQAKLGSWLLILMGQDATASGSEIIGSKFSMSVSGGCDGMEVMAILIIGILSTPVAWKFKWKGILIGGAILAFLNVLRLPMLYFAGGYYSMELFDFLHVQGGFVIFVFISVFILLRWLAWVNSQTSVATS